MVESKARSAVERYRQIKLVLVYSAIRHYAEELRGKGWSVDYYRLEDGFTFEKAAQHHLEKFLPDRFQLAEPNSFFEQEAIARLGRKLRVEIEFLPTTQFLLAREDFRAWAGNSQRLLMENHYRQMRKRFGHTPGRAISPTKSRAGSSRWWHVSFPESGPGCRLLVAGEPGRRATLAPPFYPRRASALRHFRGHDGGRRTVPLPLRSLAAAQPRPPHPARASVSRPR